MFNSLRAIFAKKTPVHPVRVNSFEQPLDHSLQRQFPSLSERAPLKQAHGQTGPLVQSVVSKGAPAEVVSRSASKSASRSMICREAVLDRNQRIAGYEFSLHDQMHSSFKEKRALVHKVYDDLLISSLAAIQAGNLLGDRLAFIDLAPASLTLSTLQSLPANNTVLMLDAPEGYVPDMVQLSAQLTRLKSLGFRLGWIIQGDDAVAPEILSFCDFLRVLTPTLDGLQIAALVADTRKARLNTGSKTAMHILGANIITADDFHLCFRAGFDYFHGSFVNSRQHWTPPKSEIDRVRVMRLLNQMRAGAENEVLAEALMQDPILTFKMLRYVNSAAMGLQKEITGMHQALVILGREKFYRWLSLMLFDVKEGSYAERSLIEQALVRARLMEQLGIALKKPALNPDQLFLTGLFSLLHLMLGQSVEQVLAQITVTPEVTEALLSRTGPLAPFLELASACEKGDAEEMEAQAQVCGVDAEVLNRELLLALTWANELSA